MRTKRLFIPIMLVLLIFSSNLIAQHHGRGNNDGPRVMMKQHNFPILSDLSEDQKKEMKALRINLLEDIQPLKNKIGELKAKKRTLETSKNPSLNSINEVIDQISDLRAQIAKKRAANKQKLRSLLTDEQRVLFDARMAKMHKKRAHAKRGYKGGKGKHNRY